MNAIFRRAPRVGPIAIAGFAIVAGLTTVTGAIGVARGAEPHKCPEGATWHKVADNTPLKECGARPLEQGCMLTDGRKHGPWIVYEKRLKCQKRALHSNFEQGRKQGTEWVWQLICAGKGPAEKCTSALAEQGPYRDDKRHGAWLEFADNGVKKASGVYFEGTKQGPWTAFDAAKKPTTVTCMNDGKVVWQEAFAATEGKANPCAVTRTKQTGDGTTTVSDNDEKASKLVALSQKATKTKLKVMYLQKAVQLVPGNKQYQQLLEAAKAELAAEK